MANPFQEGNTVLITRNAQRYGGGIACGCGGTAVGCIGVIHRISGDKAYGRFENINGGAKRNWCVCEKCAIPVKMNIQDFAFVYGSDYAISQSD